MGILFASSLPLFLLAIILWRGKWTVRDAKAGMFLLSVPAAAIVCGLLYLIAVRSGSYFAEVWSFKITAIRYYEFWNERVSCRHPVYRTEVRTRTDSKGNTSVYTVQVFDHWEHPYDVDDHPPHWELLDEYGNEHGTDRDTFERWCGIWKNKSFTDMHRDYHSINGNMYHTDWTGKFELIYPYSQTHEYQNKVRVCRSAFSFAPVSKEIAAKYPRPADVGDTSVIHCYGVPQSDDVEWMFRRMNADLGPTYKVHNLLLLFDAGAYGASELENVRNAWKGPNKNELVTCIGIGPGNSIVWCDVFSWMDDTTLHSVVRQKIAALKTYDAMRVLDILRTEIPARWRKKSFKDFDYLSFAMPTWCFATMCLVSLGMAGSWAWAIEYKMNVWVSAQCVRGPGA